MWSLFDEVNYNYNVEALKENVEPYEPEAQTPKSNDFIIDVLDKLLKDQVQMDHNDTMQHAIVKSRKRDAFGNPLGKFHSNPFLFIRRYEAESLDGMVK